MQGRTRIGRLTIGGERGRATAAARASAIGQSFHAPKQRFSAQVKPSATSDKVGSAATCAGRAANAARQATALMRFIFDGLRLEE
jgi:hypothetical protein